MQTFSRCLRQFISARLRYKAIYLFLKKEQRAHLTNSRARRSTRVIALDLIIGLITARVRVVSHLIVHRVRLLDEHVARIYSCRIFGISTTTETIARAQRQIEKRRFDRDETFYLQLLLLVRPRLLARLRLILAQRPPVDLIIVRIRVVAIWP